MTTSSKPMMRADSASSIGRIGHDLGLLLLGREAVERLALGAQRRVLQVTLLATRAADEHRVHALGVVLGQRRGALRGLVVGVGVDGEQRQSLGGRHPFDDIRAVSQRAGSPSLPRRAAPVVPLLTAVAASALVTIAAACDTGDGKTMRPPTSEQRAAQPTTTTSTSTIPGVPGVPTGVDGGAAGSSPRPRCPAAWQGHRRRPRSRRPPRSAWPSPGPTAARSTPASPATAPTSPRS